MTRSSLCARLSCGALGVAMVAAIPARAQTPADARPGCRDAAARVTAAADRATLRAALSRLQTCPDEAPGVIASLWDNLPPDSLSQSALASASAAVRDARVFDAIQRAVRTATMPAQGQRTAVRALVMLYEPDLDVTHMTSTDAHGTTRARPQLTRVTHSRGIVNGSSPLPPSVRADILTLLSEIEAGARDAEVRQFAGWARKVLTRLAAGS